MTVRFFRQRRKLFELNGRTLRTVPVEVDDVKKGGAFTTVVKYRVPGGTAKSAETTMGRDALPFYLSTSPDCTTAFGVTDDRGGAVLLLDERLTRLDFSDAERAALYGARDQLGKAAA
jgi:hypothetical protein